MMLGVVGWAAGLALALALDFTVPVTSTVVGFLLGFGMSAFGALLGLAAQR